MDIVVAADKSQLQQCYDIRYAVFSVEQGYSRETEVDGYDEEAIHILGLYGGLPCATCRIIPGERFKLGRLAVIKSARNKGFASRIVEFAHEHARTLDAKSIIANAQVPVIPFYKRLGYNVIGDVFLEEGNPHQAMIVLL